MELPNNVIAFPVDRIKRPVEAQPTIISMEAFKRLMTAIENVDEEDDLDLEMEELEDDFDLDEEEGEQWFNFDKFDHIYLGM